MRERSQPVSPTTLVIFGASGDLAHRKLALTKRTTEISLHFKRAPHALFSRVSQGKLRDEPNVLTIRIQPDEGISFGFFTKVPGSTMEVRPVAMDSRYDGAFDGVTADAYERLLLDCLVGDATLFTRADEAEAAWSWIDGIERGWAANAATVAPYEQGSAGPEESDRLLRADDRAWRPL